LGSSAIGKIDKSNCQLLSIRCTRYRLSPDVVDLIAFCTKNPEPMLSHMDALQPYGQYWFGPSGHVQRGMSWNRMGQIVPDV